MNIDKNTAALLVMDYQNDIVHEKGAFAGWGIPAHVKQQNAVENTKQLLDAARKAGIRVVYVTVEYSPGYPELANAKTPMAAGLKGGALIKGSWGAQIHDELKPLPTERIVTKSRISPFTNPALHDALKGTQTLILAGVATNFVVEATTRAAADQDYAVIIVEDCCASMNQQMHEFTLKNILPNLATISSSKEVISALE